MGPDRLSEQDLDHLVEVGHVRVDGDEDLHSVCRRLVTNQLVALVYLLKTGGPDVRGQVLATQTSMARLAPHLNSCAVVLHNTRVPLETWIRSLADCLGGEGRIEVLTALRKPVPPAESCLASVRGIGARRLDRLYAAGLYTVDQLIAADPRELAQVTGLPITLVASLIAAAESHRQAR